MKFHLLALTILFSGLASQAGTLICAGPSLYYNYHRADLGMQPRPGVVIGSMLIVSNGKVLLNENIQSGNMGNKIATYSVELSDKEQVLETTGNRQKGTSVSKKTAILFSVATSKMIKKEISREEVICQDSWMMAL